MKKLGGGTNHVRTRKVIGRDRVFLVRGKNHLNGKKRDSEKISGGKNILKFAQRSSENRGEKRRGGYTKRGVEQDL